MVLALDVYDLQQELTRLDRATRKTEDILRPDAMLIDVSLRQLQVKSWADDHGSLYPTALSVAADTALATPALADLVQRQLDDAAGNSAAIAARRERIAKLHEAARAKNQATAQAQAGDQPLALSTIAQQLWEAVRDHDWVVGNGDLRGWVQRLWDIQHPYQDVSARGGGGLGEGLGHAIGVALANRDKGRLTINIQSDGDMLFTPAAIWTAVHHRIPMLIVMYNNRTYGNDLGHQGSMAQVRGRPMERRTIGIDIDDPAVDFAALARSFGAWAEGPIEKVGRPQAGVPARDQGRRGRGPRRARGHVHAGGVTEGGQPDTRQARGNVGPPSPSPLPTSAHIAMLSMMLRPTCANVLALGPRLSRRTEDAHQGRQ